MTEHEALAEQMGEPALAQDAAVQGTEQAFGTQGVVKSEIPVALDIRLPSQFVPLQDVLEADKGKIIELDLDLDGNFPIEVNGRELGKGTLLKVGDRIGVQITQWNVASSS